MDPDGDASKISEGTSFISRPDVDVSSKKAGLEGLSVITSLDEVVSPFESEAEATILKTLEQNIEDKRTEALASGESDAIQAAGDILVGVPRESIHLFADERVPSPSSNSDTKQEQLHSQSLPALPYKARPSLNDIASRMKMMESRRTIQKQPPSKLNFKDAAKKVTMMNMAASAKAEDSKPTQAGEIPNIDNETDQEGLAIDIEGGAGKEGMWAQNDDEGYQGKPNNSSVKVLNRKYCGPCYKFKGFLYAHKSGLRYGYSMILFFVVPLLCLSTLLFHLVDNRDVMNGASTSWTLLFILRNGITLVLAQVSQFVIIDYIVLETRLAVRLLGRVLTLMAMQAKGWPILLIFWAIWNFILLVGNAPFKAHWLHYQEGIKMFSEANPGFSESQMITYTRLQFAMIVAGTLVMIKRVLFAMVLGKKKHFTYSSELTAIMKKVLLISEVAVLSEDISADPQSGSEQLSPRSQQPGNAWLYSHYDKKEEATKDMENEDADEENTSTELYDISEVDVDEGKELGEENKKNKKNIRHGFRKHLKKLNIMPNAVIRDDSAKNLFSDEEQLQIESLLGEWEEVEIKKEPSWGDTSVEEVLQFRETMKYIGGTHPLSIPFGAANTRKECMVSAQIVYKNLLKNTPNSKTLHFNTIMTLALDGHGKIDQEKARALIRLLRPDREGNLTLLDFVKSCDSLYKRLRTFQASAMKAAQLDVSFEQLGNIFFYILLTAVLLIVAGIPPTQLFISMTSVLLPFAFLFSSAASKAFEGVLLVVGRQAYDIGDRISVSNPQNDTSTDGSITWFVENISLYTTTVRLAASNEVATYSNGSLASLRIINANRSPKSIVAINLKFGSEVPYQKVKIFADVLRSFVQDRPREWLKLVAFRATAVKADLGFIEYLVVLQHTESWQNVGVVAQSKAAVASFCLEVTKKMGMRFIAPPMPVDLSMGGEAAAAVRAIHGNTSKDAGDFLDDKDDDVAKRQFDTGNLDNIKDLFKTS